MFDTSIATPVFFWFPFVWNKYFHPLNFSLYVSLGLVLVSCRQCISVSYFWIHSASLHLLVGIFNLFMFKVIINKYVCSTVSSLELFRSQRYYDFQPLTCVVFGFKVKNSLEDSMVLAQKQKYRPIKQDRNPRDKSMHLWVPCLWQRRQEYTMEKR